MKNLKNEILSTLAARVRTIKGWTMLFALALAVGATLIASPAAADGPTRSEVVIPYSTVLTDLCQFDVAWSGALRGTETDFFDHSGALTRATVQGLTQDTFTANGKTLVGTLFPVTLQLLFDSSGNLTHLFGVGLAERIRLPDGSLSLAAGRVDLINYPDMLAISPDHGNPGNVAGICAALAP